MMLKKEALLILSVFFLSVSLLKGQNNGIEFETISLEQGLSQATVYSIVQDERGFLWIGTEAGLNRYDGYEFKVYDHDPNDEGSISNFLVFSELVDSEGNLWVGTDNGLNRYSHETDKFKRFSSGEGGESVLGEKIYALKEDGKKNIWIGTNKGLSYYSISESRFVREFSEGVSLENVDVRSISVDANGNVWVGTNGNGLLYLKKSNKGYSLVFHPVKGLAAQSLISVFSLLQIGSEMWIGSSSGLYVVDVSSLQLEKSYSTENNVCKDLVNCTVTSLFRSSSGQIWVGTYGGLSVIRNGAIENYTSNPNYPKSLSANRVLTTFEDRGGVIWTGTFGGGLSKYDPRRNKFSSLIPNPQDENSLSYGHVRQMIEDSRGNLWITTDGGGLNMLNRKTGEFRHFKNDPKDPGSLSSNRVFSVMEDTYGLIWVGTYAGGVNIFNPRTEKFHQYVADTGEVDYKANNVRDILQASDGSFYIGTEGGVFWVQPGNSFDAKHQMKYYKNDPDDPSSLSYNGVIKIIEQPKGTIWIATMGGGLNKFDPVTESFKSYRYNPDDPTSVCSDFLVHIFFDQKENCFWISSHGGGISKFDLNKETFENFGTEEDLPDNSIYGILKDKNGFLWLSTNKGIGKYFPGRGTIKEYRVSDGLQSNEFNGGSCYISPEGEFFFGGIKGLNYFFPDSIRDNPNVPEVVITDFLLFNKHVGIGEKVNNHVLLTKAVYDTEEIELNYSDNVITFEFAALDLADPIRNNYAYMLEGFEEDWNYIGHRRYASYTNLPHGDYVFRVKGSNCDGVWNNTGASIRLKVYPPWWRTTTFYAISVLALFLIVYLYIKLRERKLRIDKRNLEAEVIKRTDEIEEQKEELSAQAKYLEEVNKRLEKLSIVARETANAITIFDNKGNIEYRNKAFYELYGNVLKETVLKEGQNISEIDESFAIRKHFVECLQRKEPITFVEKKTLEDGRNYWIQTTLTPVILAEDHVEKLVSIDTDITEIKQAEETIKVQAVELEKLSIVASKTDNSVMIADANGQIEWVNEGFTRLMGYTLDEYKAVCNNLITNAITVDEVKKSLKDNILAKKSTTYYSQNTTKSGDKLWVQTTITPFFDRKGHLLKLIAIESNIDKLKQAEEEIKKKNIQITDSINYAQKIQQSILPSDEMFSQIFTDFFVLFKPRDIVSGDFYWLSKSEDKVFLAVSDCTGHGVPGGFMSMMGTALLNEIVNEKKIHSPARILTQLNTGVRNSLNQDIDSGQEDGMDMGLVCFDTVKRKLTFAGANHALFIFHNGQFEKVDGDIYSVGGTLSVKDGVKYRNHEREMKDESVYYMFTDGYPDQFGGEKNKKFMSEQFINLLEKINTQPLVEQLGMLESAFENWRGETRQIDDVLVVGVKL